MQYVNGLTLQLVDLRDEIARYEREFRPFPPRSGSVSKPHQSTEPEMESGYKHLKLARAGEGIPVGYKIDLTGMTSQLCAMTVDGDPMDWPMADEVFRSGSAR